MPFSNARGSRYDWYWDGGTVLSAQCLLEPASVLVQPDLRAAELEGHQFLVRRPRPTVTRMTPFRPPEAEDLATAYEAPHLADAC